jgi:hypothetical protein
MAYVLLILGLIAAGIYTENWLFYLAASIAGFCWFVIVITVALIGATVKKAVDSGEFKLIRNEYGNKVPTRVRGRRRY